MFLDKNELFVDMPEDGKTTQTPVEKVNSKKMMGEDSWVTAIR